MRERSWVKAIPLLIAAASGSIVVITAIIAASISHSAFAPRLVPLIIWCVFIGMIVE